ncbi:MAG: LD-carboxypeptidase [Burkholderiaceae bacterium]|nr:LD-carboxypeptidase [Burkholderiaceae bacterium]
MTRGGARIEIIAPSGAHLSLERFDRALERLRERGHELRCSAPRDGWQRFGATDDERLAQIHRAARAHDLDAVMITRGGYGLSRLLDRIDWAQVAESVARGVRWIGYSDFTAFQLALLARTGASSFAGPGVAGDFGVDEPDPYMLEHFDALMDGGLLSVRWREPWPECGHAAAAVAHLRRPTAAGAAPPASNRSSDSIVGTLWGGNLSLVAAAVGTPYLPVVEGGVLFLEDVAEHPYRLERMLHQLLYAGVLETQQAVVLGEFTEWKPSPHDNGYDLAAVVEHFRSRIRVPIVTGFPFGHVPRKAVLGVGLRYRLERLPQTAADDWMLAPIDARPVSSRR